MAFGNKNNGLFSGVHLGRKIAKSWSNGVVRRPFACPSCGKDCGQKEFLAVHVAKKHSGGQHSEAA